MQIITRYFECQSKMDSLPSIFQSRLAFSHLDERKLTIFGRTLAPPQTMQEDEQSSLPSSEQPLSRRRPHKRPRIESSSSPNDPAPNDPARNDPTANDKRRSESLGGIVLDPVPPIWTQSPELGSTDSTDEDIAQQMSDMDDIDEHTRYFAHLEQVTQLQW